MFRLLLFYTLLSASIAPSFILGVSGAEICNNGIDDDLDGLTDCEDPDCYFSDAACSCTQTTVIWAVTNNNTLVWFNPNTGQEKAIGSFSTSLSDVAWSPDGKMYGITTSGALYQINPGTGALTAVSSNISAPGQVTALCTDEAGNFYYATRAGSSPRYVYKYDPVSGIQSKVANIGTYECAGDIAFINGVLYLTTIGHDMLEVDISTGTYNVINLPVLTNEYYGLVSDANGVLYASSGKDIYIIDPSTGNTSLLFTSTAPSSQFYGLSILSDNCQSQVCNPGVEISAPALPYCAGTLVTLSATIPPGFDAYTGPFNWEGPGGTQTANSISVSTPGQYILSIGTGSCTAADTVTLSFTALPFVDLGPDQSINTGQTITLQPILTDPGFTYTWSDGLSGPSRNTAVPDTFILFAANACGTDKDTIIVTLNPQVCNLQVDINAGVPPYCTGIPVNLTAVIPIGSDPYTGVYTWTTPSGNSTGATITATSTGQYKVAVNSGSCSDIDSIQINFTAPPVVVLGADQEICPGQSIILDLSGDPVNGVTYTWEDNSGSLPRTVTTEGIYSLTGTNICGTDTDTLIVSTDSTCFCRVLAPTAFSPNGDGRNDRFVLLNGCPDPIELELMEIYNRWNEKVFSSNNASTVWDGTLNGQPQPVDTYIYIARGKAGTVSFNLKGVLTLLR